jgi:hypothetical protein
MIKNENNYYKIMIVFKNGERDVGEVQAYLGRWCDM